MYFFLFISIHIAAAVVASRDSEEGEAGMPELNSGTATPGKKKAKATPDGRIFRKKKFLTNFTTEIIE
jgi:hypothetical protein